MPGAYRHPGVRTTGQRDCQRTLGRKTTVIPSLPNCFKPATTVHLGLPQYSAENRFHQRLTGELQTLRNRRPNRFRVDIDVDMKKGGPLGPA